MISRYSERARDEPRERIAGRSHADVLLAQAADLERLADTEIRGMVRGDRGSYLGWVMAYSPAERKEMKAEAARLLAEALRAADNAQRVDTFAEQVAHTRPYPARAGGPHSRRASKRR